MEKIDVLDHGFVRLVDSMGSDLSIVRAARVSYDAAWRAGENEKSDEKLINYLWKHKHSTPFESVTFTFEVKAPIFVFRQWHRHRTWCLSGDSFITFEKPDRMRKGIRTATTMKLSDLYRKWQPTIRTSRPERQTNPFFPRSRIQKMNLRVYDEKNKEFTTGKIFDIVSSGVKDVFEIILANGKKLKCSKDHQLLTTVGWQRLEEAIGLVFKGKTAGMTKESFILTNGFVENHVPWNKGVTGYTTNRVFTEEAKEKIRKARSGENSNFWKGGVSSERSNIARWTTEQAPKVHAKFNYTCQFCNKIGGRLHAHHVKPVVSHPELALDFENLITVCKPCHSKYHFKSGESRLSKGQTLRALPSKVIRVEYIGQEETYDISVEGPHHNFVANGIVVHNSFNELSARYKELPEEFYLPDVTTIGAQSTDNKQMRVIEDKLSSHDWELRTAEIDMAKRWMEQSFSNYRTLLNNGWPRELARSVLPVATYSHMFATVNLLNLFKFLTLRTHQHAQYEIRVYAEAMLQLVKPIVPVCVKAWCEND